MASASKGMEQLPSNIRNITQLHQVIERLNKRIISLENMTVIVLLHEVGMGNLVVQDGSSYVEVKSGQNVGDY